MKDDGILLDFGSLVVHVIMNVNVGFYALENLWDDAGKICQN